METCLQPCPTWTELEVEHRQWLSAFDRRHLQKWGDLRNDDYEAALCEAVFRRLFQASGITVEPNEDLAGVAPEGSEARPDFRCSHPEGAFFVEVTCISIATAVEQTGIPHPWTPGAYAYGPLNSAIFRKALRKYRQYSNTDRPTLLAVGTFHQAASLFMSKKFANMLLTGETSISWNVNTETGEGIGDAFQSTELRLAPFFKPESLEEARTGLSGLLLCGVGYVTPKVLGILHPLATRPFDKRLLPDVHFGEVQINQATGQLCTSWPTEVQTDEASGIEEFLP